MRNKLALSLMMFLLPLVVKAQVAIIGSTINSVVYSSPAYPSLNAAVAACPLGGGCTVIINAPASLSANLTTAASTTLQFYQPGALTTTGFTLTANGPIVAGSYRIFSGSGTVRLGPQVATAPVEWFGAVGDGPGGTDDTAAFQTCLNALTRGQCHLQPLTYTISSPLTITRSHIGLDGVEPGLTSNTLYPTPSPSKIVTTSASADIIDVSGTSNSNTIAFNRFTNFSIGRTVAPSTSGGNARGLSLQFVDAPYVYGINSADSIAGFFIHGMASQGMGVIANSVAVWGYDGVTETSGGSMGGFVLDSSNGVTNNSARFVQDGTFSNLPHSATAAYTTFGFSLQGDQTHDAFVDNFESATVDFGVLISQTNGGGIAGSTDIRFTNAVNDSCFVTCFKVANVLGSVEISAGWEATSVVATNTPVVEIDNSTRVNVSHVDVFASAGNTGTPAIKVDSSQLTRIENDNVSVLLTSAEDGISFTNSKGGVISGNTVFLAGTGSTNGINLGNSVGNVVSSNTINGTATNGIALDSTSAGIGGLDTNQIGNPTFGTITHLIIDNGTTQSARTLAATLTGGCTTGSSSFATCTNTLNWSDGGFTQVPIYVTCQGIGPSDPRASSQVTTVTATTVTVQTVTQGSVAVNFGALSCIGRS